MTDLEIARSVSHNHIFEVAQALGIPSEDLIPYGRYKAKIAPQFAARTKHRPLGRYILVTAINHGALSIGPQRGCHVGATVARSGLWYQRWRDRRGARPGLAHGGYQSSFHRRCACRLCQP